MSSSIDIYAPMKMNPESLNEIEEGLVDALNEDAFVKFNNLCVESILLTEAYKAQNLEIEDLRYSLEDVNIGANNKPVTQRQTTGVIERIQAFIAKIITWIADTIDKFMNSVGNALTSNEEFIKQNRAILYNLPKEIVNDISITAIPYWDYDKRFKRLTEGTLPYEPTMPQRLEDMIENPDKNQKLLKNTGEMYKEFFPLLEKNDKNDVRRAAALYYLNMHEPATETFTNKKAQKAIQSMCDFLQNYKAYADRTAAASKAVNDLMKKINARLTQLKAQGDRISNAQAKLNSQAANAAAAQAKQQNQQNNSGNAQQGQQQQQGQQAGTNPGNPPGGTGKVESYSFTYLHDLYSALEGMSLRESELAQFIPVDEAGAIGNVTQTGGTGTGGTQPQPQNNAGQHQQQGQQNAGNGHQGQQQQQVQAPSQKRMDLTNQAAQRNKSRQDAAGVAIKCLQYTSSIIGVRMTVCQNIANHFRSVLNEVMKGVQQYQRNSATSQENKNYNDQKAAQQKYENDQKVSQIQQQRREANAATGGVKGAWRQFWGNS